MFLLIYQRYNKRYEAIEPQTGCLFRAGCDVLERIQKKEPLRLLFKAQVEDVWEHLNRHTAQEPYIVSILEEDFAKIPKSLVFYLPWQQDPRSFQKKIINMASSLKSRQKDSPKG